MVLVSSCRTVRAEWKLGDAAVRGSPLVHEKQVAENCHTDNEKC